MATRSSCIVLLCGLLWIALPLHSDAKQDHGEIPATIGDVQDAEPVDGKPKAIESDTTGLESAPKKMDLVTLMREEDEEFEKQSIKIPATWKRMWQDSHIWADPKKKQVIIRGAVCMQDGFLEMFACPRDTKEHEAIVSVHGKASEVHATLLALKINPGQPAVWREEYYPVHGPIMNIEVWWSDENGKLVKTKAQDMIRNTETGKAMKCDFVFGGSEKRYDPYEKRDVYFADDGPMINVANQSDAMIDVSIESSQAAHGSLFEAFTENVPPKNTKVYIIFSASDKKIEAKTGKPTRETLQKEQEIRRAAMEKRMKELDEARDKAEAEKNSKK